MRPCLLALALTVGLTTPVAAEERVLKLASVVPDGTAWAREMHAFGREVEVESHNAVRIKWYFGGIAGDETEMVQRIDRGQLDGAASGGALCQHYAPSLRMMLMHGLFQTRGEAGYVLGRLRERIDAEFTGAGMVNLGEAPLGATILFTRSPVRSLDDLRRIRMFFWKDDEVGIAMSQRIGLQVVADALAAAGAAYDERRVDGFFVIPQAALAWQLSSRVRYVTALPVNYVTACLAVSNRSFQRLTYEQQQAVRTAAAKLASRMSDVNQQQDEVLMHGAFARQGLTVIEPDDQFRHEYYATMRGARGGVGGQLLPKALLDEVLALLADYRAVARKAN